jgi:hypothetical protein
MTDSNMTSATLCMMADAQTPPENITTASSAPLSAFVHALAL